MKLLGILPLVVGSAAAGILVSTFPAQALTWTLQNVQFDDGATATGSFDYDSVNNILNASSIIISSPTAGTRNFSDPDNNPISLSPTSFSLASNDQFLTLRLDFSSALLNTTPANTTISLFTTSGYGANDSVDKFTLASSSVISSDVPSSGVPFDIPGGATIPTVGSLLALGVMRKVKKSIASKTRLTNPA